MRIRRAPEAPAGSRSSFDLLLTMACPRCQAPLTIEEHSTAIACLGCKESFLIPPRTYPLEVVVSPGVATADAHHDAKSYLRAEGHRATWIGPGGWVLLPYWRYRALAFQWVEGLRQAPRTAAKYHDLEVRTFDLLLPASDAAPRDLPPRPGIFAAHPLSPEVVAGANQAPVDLPLEAAEVRVRSEIDVRSDSPDLRILKRRLKLISEEMLVVYLPFFSLEYRFNDEVNEVLVDGILGGVVAHRPHAGERPPPQARPAPPASKLLLLPLRCPGCSAPLPLASHDRIRACATCGRGWETVDGGLAEIEQRLALTTAGSAPGDRYLPFWVVNTKVQGFFPLSSPDAGSQSGDGVKVYVPAFESWEVEKLILGGRLTRARLRYPTIEPGGSDRLPGTKSAELLGGTLGRRDAERLAWVVLGVLATADPSTFSYFMEDGTVEAESAELHWIPFRPSGFYLHEPLSGALVRGWPGPDEPAAVDTAGPGHGTTPAAIKA